MTNPAADGAVELVARAKLTLYLHILARRADGYHELDGLVAFAALGDRLTLAPAEELTLDISGPFADALARAGDNLVLRAARLLRARFAIRSGAEIRLEKRLPVAAGLGGGSADAAAALRGLSSLWRLDASEAELAGLAAELGADVPVCLLGLPSFMGGVGERLKPAPALPELGVILVNPRVPLATAEVFAARAGGFSRPSRWAEPVRDAASLAALLQERRNDLTQPALALVPEIGQVLTALSELPQVLLARMAGSGASCFGLVRGAAEAAAGAEALRARLPGWWVAASRVEGPGALPALGKLG